jgi:uncharacterized protein (DUF1697 family)
MASYVALLRGINVGGKNLIRMPDPAASFEACRHDRRSAGQPWFG